MVSNIDSFNFYTIKRSYKTILLKIIFYHWLFLFSVFHTKKKSIYLLFNSDRNKTGLRRFKPNSCVILLDEQSNPLQRLHRKDITSRHRGDKRKCRYDRLTFIILLSLWYLLSDDQIFFHSIYLVH